MATEKGATTMSNTRLVLAATVALGLASATAFAAPPASVLPTGENLQILVQTIRANRKALVAVNLALTPEQSAAFWPIYDRYQQELSAIGDRQIALIQDYTSHFSDLSNEKALQLVNDYLAADADRVKLRQTYLPEFAKVVPGRTVARFFQIENKMDAVIRYDLAATIPVVEQTATAKSK